MPLTDEERLTIPETLRGKAVAITGGNSGMGLATAKILASYGARVSIAGRSPTKLAAAEEELVALASPADVLATQLDVADDRQVDAWIARTVRKFGRLDAAVNAAALEAPRMEPLVDIDNATWATVLGANLTGVMYSMRAELRAMSEGGAIVNVCSVLGSVGLEGNAAYSAAKHGMLGLSKSVAKEVWPSKRIRVNVMSPGFCETPMMDNAARILGGRMPTPMETIQKRCSKPHEMAHPIIFLLSSHASYITGMDYHVDGGWIC